MSLSKVLQLIDDEKIKTTIENMENLPFEYPYIISESLRVLDDDSIMCNIIDDSNKKALCIMLDMYFKRCYYEYIEDLKLNKLLAFGKIEIYKIAAHNGIRFATANEVKQGVKGLIPEFIFPAGENEYKLMCLLQWTFCGTPFFFRNAGYKLTYDSNGKPTETFWDMAQMCAPQLMELFNWISDRKKLEKCIKLMGKMKKAGGYKYAQYEKDEVEEDVSVKQLVYNIANTFPKNSKNMEYRRALALAIAKKQNKKILTPYEISQLREVYEKYALDKDRATYSRHGRTDCSELQQECEMIVRCRYEGVINPDHFVYKIIGTLEKYGYSKCSVKQYSFIEDALRILREGGDESNSSEGANNVEDVGSASGLGGTLNSENTEIITEDDIDMSLEALSNAIGAGLFEG